LDINNIRAADLQGTKRSAESAKSKLEKDSSGKAGAKDIADSLIISSASIEMEKKLNAVSEKLSEVDSVRREKVDEVKERLSKGELENEDAIKEAVDGLLESLHRNSEMISFL